MTYFITFEGGDGCGKTTQLGLLCDALWQAGVDYVRTREPGGTESAQLIRALLLDMDAPNWHPSSQALLHYTARNEHLEQLIRPSLQDGKWVICDRFADSTMAYQHYAQSVPKALLEELYTQIVADYEPHITIYLRLPVDQAMKRIRRRAEKAGAPQEQDYYEQQGEGFQKRLVTGFDAIAAQNPNRICIINASRSIEDIHHEVIRLINSRFGSSLLPISTVGKGGS